MVSGRNYGTQISSPRQITREKNDEFPMTKAEGMTNDQMTRDGAVGSSLLGLCLPRRSCAKAGASFVIRHSPATPELSEGGCFVISGYPS